MNSILPKLFVLTLLGLFFINTEVMAQQPPPLMDDDFEKTSLTLTSAISPIKNIIITTTSGEVIAEIKPTEKSTIYTLLSQLPKGQYLIQEAETTELLIK